MGRPLNGWKRLVTNNTVADRVYRTKYRRYGAQYVGHVVAACLEQVRLTETAPRSPGALARRPLPQSGRGEYDAPFPVIMNSH